MDNRTRVLESIRDGYGKVFVREPSRPPLFCPRDKAALSERWHAMKKKREGLRDELIRTLERELELLSAKAHVVHAKDEVHHSITSILKEAGAKQAVTWFSPFLEELGVYPLLRSYGVQFNYADRSRGTDRAAQKRFMDHVIKADVGISGTDYAIADSGTLVLKTFPNQERATTLLPPVHIALIKSECILANSDEFITSICIDLEERGEIESCITFISGPSRTADIELTLVCGIHGPKELHLIVFDPRE